MFEQRRTRPTGTRRHRDWRLKAYQISARGGPVPAAAVDAAEAAVAAEVERSTGPARTSDGTAADADDGRQGVGFTILHHGEDAYWLLIGLWDDGILSHRTLRADLDDPATFVPLPAGGPVACVWELVVHGHERDAYVAHVLVPDTPDVDGYLADTVSVEPASGSPADDAATGAPATAPVDAPAADAPAAAGAIDAAAPGARAEPPAAAAPADPVSLIRRFNAAWARHDLDGLMELMGDHPVYRPAAGPHAADGVHGRRQVRQTFAEAIRRERAGAPVTAPGEIVAFGRGAISFWSAHDPAGNGAGDRIEGIDLWTFDGGRVASRDSYRKVGGAGR